MTTTASRNRLAAKLSILIATPFLLAGLAGCGAPAAQQEPTAGAQSYDDWEVAFKDCMAKAGFTDLGASGQGDGSDAVKAAAATCKEQLGEQPVMEKPSAEKVVEAREHELRFAQCLRDEGYDVADPDEGMGADIEGIPEDVVNECWESTL